MTIQCRTCGSIYDDEHQWTICPHGPLWAAPDAYCKKHDLVNCLLHQGEKEKTMKPSIGRVVHYVLSTQDGTMEHKVGEHRPAFIVKVWNDYCVQLQVFTDGTNDRLDGANVVWVKSVFQNETDKLARTWHWPERE